MSAWARFGALLAMVSIASCRPSREPARSGSPSESPGEDIAAGSGGTARGGRWLVWAGAERTWGSFITDEGAGPLWPLDVAGAPYWSDDGRWLTSCAPGFVAARWMGSARPSRIAVLKGGCASLKWAPGKNSALALAKNSNQARLLTFTPGEKPSIHEASFDIALADGEKLRDSGFFEWSATGDAFLVQVTAARQSSIRWVDATAKPGRVRRLLTPNGFEAEGSCSWAPRGQRVACLAMLTSPDKDPRRPAPPVLALFEIQGGEVSGRLLFEARWLQLLKMSWLDQDRLVFQERDATRLLNVTGTEPPITLSATAGDFAVSPAAPRLAYVNHRGLCLREGGNQLGTERLLVPGPVKGVTWASNGRHLLTHRADERAVIVVTDAGTEEQRTQETAEVRPGLKLGAAFSDGGTLLFGRAFTEADSQQKREPLRSWSLADFGLRRLLPQGFDDSWFAQSPDDKALVTRADGELAPLQLGLIRNAQTTPRPLGETGPDPRVRWQPGRAIAVSETPAPPSPSDPERERVAVAATHPLALGTAYVRGSRECSAALIDPHFVVTAHHCVEDLNQAARVVLGRHLKWAQEYTVPPHRILHHPKVRHIERLDLCEYDLALIELPRPAPAQARPFPLGRTEEGAPGSEVVLAGYGGDWLVGLSAQPELRYGISRLVPQAAGIAGALTWRSAEGAENAGCFGDSGGPVLARRSDGSFALLGIHYGTAGTDYTRACGDTGVAGDLRAERAWLNEAADKLTISRRGSGPPRPRPIPF